MLKPACNIPDDIKREPGLNLRKFAPRNHIMRNLALSFSFLLLTISGTAQGVTIGSSNPADPSAILDLQSTNKGLLLPKLSTTQRNAIVNPAQGLLIINTTTDCIETYFNTSWVPIQCACTGSLPAPAQINGAATVCPNSSQVLYIIPQVPGAGGYQWTVTGLGTLTSGQGNDSIRVNFSNSSGTATISVVSLDSCGNVASNVTSYLVNVQLPSASFTLNPSPATVNSPVTYTAATSGATYAWTFASGNPSSSVSQTGTVTWANAGTYAIGLTVTQNGCSNSSTQNFTVNPGCPPFNGNALAGPYTQYGFCWYLTQPGVSCDVLCNSLPGGANLANSAANAWNDNCSGATALDISYYFRNNGNAANWAGGNGSTGYHTLGYGYTGSTYYGKCNSGTSMGVGTFPGDNNNDPTRALVCPCYVSP